MVSVLRGTARSNMIAVVRGVSESYSKALSRTPQNINRARAKLQHAAYVQALETRVKSVVHVPAAADLADCVFIEDVAVCIGRKVMMTKPGAPSRRGEVDGVARVLEQMHASFPVPPWSLVSMEEEEAFVDGGDVLTTDRHCFVGLSSRTNEAGYRSLRRLLGSQLPNGENSVIAIEVIDDLHLKSIATHAGRGQLAVHDSEGGRYFRRKVEEVVGQHHGYALHMVPQAAANVLSLPQSLLVPEGFASLPEIQALAALSGYQVLPQVSGQWVVRVEGIEEEAVVREYGPGLVEVPNSEFAKADGALTCRSLLLPAP